jgi:hypothetical protein
MKHQTIHHRNVKRRALAAGLLVSLALISGALALASGPALAEGGGTPIRDQASKTRRNVGPNWQGRISPTMDRAIAGISPIADIREIGITAEIGTTMDRGIIAISATTVVPTSPTTGRTRTSIRTITIRARRRGSVSSSDSDYPAMTNREHRR